MGLPERSSSRCTGHSDRHRGSGDSVETHAINLSTRQRIASRSGLKASSVGGRMGWFIRRISSASPVDRCGIRSFDTRQTPAGSGAIRLRSIAKWSPAAAYHRLGKRTRRTPPYPRGWENRAQRAQLQRARRSWHAGPFDELRVLRAAALWRNQCALGEWFRRWLRYLDSCPGTDPRGLRSRPRDEERGALHGWRQRFGRKRSCMRWRQVFQSWPPWPPT